jgi:hypothetical protein
MPFPKIYTDEVVGEWLQLHGYLVEIGVLVSTASTGGRWEADVVGAKVKEIF